MRNLFPNLIFLLKYLFIAERSLEPGLDAPVTAMIRDRFPFMEIIKTCFWILMGLAITFLISGLD